jgi:hypothetical protein
MVYFSVLSVNYRLSLRKDQAFRLWRSDTTRALNDTVHRNSISRHSRRNTVSSDMISPGALEDEEVDELGQTAHSEDRRAHRRMSSVSVYSDDAKSARDSLATLLNILDTELPRSTTPYPQSPLSNLVQTIPTMVIFIDQTVVVDRMTKTTFPHSIFRAHNAINVENPTYPISKRTKTTFTLRLAQDLRTLNTCLSTS